MDYRKLIKFGENSYVISLPTKWIKANKLKKGDVINIVEQDSTILISPNEIKKDKTTISEVTIDLDKLKTLKYLRTHLTAAYINGFDQITIIGSNINKETQKIRELTKNFIALEMIEQTPQRIILREFVNLQEASLQESVRRIDRIVISMAEDAENNMLGKGDYIEILKQKDTDISRMYHLIFRTIKCAQKPENRTTLKIDIGEMLYYWELTTFLERVANQIKRIPRYTPVKTNPKVIAAYKKLVEYYKETMKANYTKNINSAIDLINERKELFEEFESLSKYLPKTSQIMIEKMKNAADLTSQISKTFLRHHYK